MSRRESAMSGLAHVGVLGLLLVAAAFPISLMIFNPTLMFERGWEQYAGTSFYFIALLILGRQSVRLWAEERAFRQARTWLDDPTAIADGDHRLLPRRIRALAGEHFEVAQVVELNREASALDQDHVAGRFTLPRYILYLLPVIGFIGTVEGISKALMNISKVLPMVKELDGFLSNLTGVTHALNIAFDSTLLALFLSASLMLVQTVVSRRSEDLLLRVDRWVVEHVLPQASPRAQLDGRLFQDLTAQLQRVEQAMGGASERVEAPLERFGLAIDRLNTALVALERGSAGIGLIGQELDSLKGMQEPVRKGLATLTRIESALPQLRAPEDQLDRIQRGLERSTAAIEGLAGHVTHAFERSNRVTQEQLARTLDSLKDAIDLLNVSMEQSNVLYRSIVKKIVPPAFDRSADERAA